MTQLGHQQVPQYSPQQSTLPPYMGGPPFVDGLTGNPTPHQYYEPQPINQKLPFLATLDLLDFSQLTNDPILHSPHWPQIPQKLPFDIPKFYGKLGEDPKNHGMTFHFWCFSNSLMDDSIHLCLF